MQTNVQEFYARNVMPMSEQERLKLAALIINDLSNKTETSGTEEKPKRKTGSIRELFGKGRSGDPNGSDNEKIDADLAREYASTHEDEY
jgi:hypothetical protein